LNGIGNDLVDFHKIIVVQLVDVNRFEVDGVDVVGVEPTFAHHQYLEAGLFLFAVQ
jgi:hypothetical protein